jgi:hypothetical protein
MKFGFDIVFWNCYGCLSKNEYQFVTVNLILVASRDFCMLTYSMYVNMIILPLELYAAQPVATGLHSALSCSIYHVVVSKVCTHSRPDIVASAGHIFLAHLGPPPTQSNIWYKVHCCLFVCSKYVWDALFYVFTTCYVP